MSASNRFLREISGAQLLPVIAESGKQVFDLLEGEGRGLCTAVLPAVDCWERDAEPDGHLLLGEPEACTKLPHEARHRRSLGQFGRSCLPTDTLTSHKTNVMMNFISSVDRRKSRQAKQPGPGRDGSGLPAGNRRSHYPMIIGDRDDGGGVLCHRFEHGPDEELLVTDQNGGALAGDFGDAGAKEAQRNPATAQRAPHAERYRNPLQECAGLGTQDERGIPVGWNIILSRGVGCDGWFVPKRRQLCGEVDARRRRTGWNASADQHRFPARAQLGERLLPEELRGVGPHRKHCLWKHDDSRSRFTSTLLEPVHARELRCRHPPTVRYSAEICVNRLPAAWWSWRLPGGVQGRR